MRSFLFVLISAPLLPAASVNIYDAAIQQATALSQAQRFSEALNLLSDAFNKANDNHEPAWAALIQNNRGFIYERQGKYSDAEASFYSALRGMAAAGRIDGPETAPIMGNLAALYYEAGRFSESERLLTRSISTLRTPRGQEAQMGTLLNDLGAVYLAEHKNELAQETAERALKLWSVQAAVGVPGQAFSYTVLGEAYDRLGNPHDAEACFERALDIWQTTAGATDVQTAKGLANLGVFYLNSGAVEKAEPLFRTASGIFKTSRTSDMFHLYFLYSYARLERKLGHKKEAKDLEKEFTQLSAVDAQQQIARGVVDASSFQTNP